MIEALKGALSIVKHAAVVGLVTLIVFQAQFGDPLLALAAGVVAIVWATFFAAGFVLLGIIKMPLQQSPVWGAAIITIVVGSLYPCEEDTIKVLAVIVISFTLVYFVVYFTHGYRRIPS